MCKTAYIVPLNEFCAGVWYEVGTWGWNLQILFLFIIRKEGLIPLTVVFLVVIKLKYVGEICKYCSFLCILWGVWCEYLVINLKHVGEICKYRSFICIFVGCLRWHLELSWNMWVKYANIFPLYAFFCPANFLLVCCIECANPLLKVDWKVCVFLRFFVQNTGARA